jgi:hypothetical protein
VFFHSLYARTLSCIGCPVTSPNIKSPYDCSPYVNWPIDISPHSPKMLGIQSCQCLEMKMRETKESSPVGARIEVQKAPRGWNLERRLAFFLRRKGGLGECPNLPQRGPGQNPNQQRFLHVLSTNLLLQINIFLLRSKMNKRTPKMPWSKKKNNFLFNNYHCKSAISLVI